MTAAPEAVAQPRTPQAQLLMQQIAMTTSLAQDGQTCIDWSLLFDMQPGEREFILRAQRLVQPHPLIDLSRRQKEARRQKTADKLKTSASIDRNVRCVGSRA
jgi:hypothetical protein